MTAPNRFIYFEGPPPGPPPVCKRIKTNQFGQILPVNVLQRPLVPDKPGIGTWTGSVSGASGTHMRYEIEVDPVNPNLGQQYIVMRDVTGDPFTAGEDLIGALL